jgi:DNA-binding NarL/FixJ family response regulator
MADILLIDNEKDLLSILQSALTARGHHVIDRDSAEGAMEVLATEECDLVVVDEIMPGLHGSDLIKILRRQGNDVPVILMTGLGTRSLIEPMKKLGALVVAKPAAGSSELLKDLVPAVEEALKGEAELVELISRTVKLALKLGKTAPSLRWLLDCELRIQVSAAVNHDPARIKQFLGEIEVGPASENSILLKGDIWHLAFNGESADYPRQGNQSLTWLHKLLATPNKLFSVAELQGDPRGTLGADAGIGTERVTDDAGFKRIKARLEELDDIAKETGGSPSHEQEKADLLMRVQEALRDKKMGSPLKVAHHNRAAQIRTFREKKLAKDMPALAAHLRAALKLDFPHFGYYPPPGMSAWQV